MYFFKKSPAIALLHTIADPGSSRMWHLKTFSKTKFWVNNLRNPTTRGAQPPTTICRHPQHFLWYFGHSLQFIILRGAPCVVGGSAPRGGALKYFTPNINLLALFDHQKREN